MELKTLVTAHGKTAAIMANGVSPVPVKFPPSN
jgi:hypothetical protein